MSTSRYSTFCFWFAVVLLVEEAIRYAFREGDFQGYIIAGEYALHNKDIYSHWLNTWPPLFSLFGIPLYFMNAWSPVLLRILWQLGTLWSFYHVAKRMLFMVYEKRLVFKASMAAASNEVLVSNPLFLLPFLLSFKYLLDNLANIQINVYMLVICVEAVYQLIHKRRTALAAFLIALTLSLKVYTLFFFAWFVLMRYWKMVLYTLGFVMLLNIPCFLFYGTDQALLYYQHWWKEIAQGFPMILHKNQSFFAAVWRFTVAEDAGLGIRTHLLSMSMDASKKLVYLIVLGVGIYPALVLWKKSATEKGSIRGMSLFLALIPLLSPLAWKAYFIFLVPALIELSGLFLHSQLKKWEQVVYWVSCGLLILSADIFLGSYYSDVAELFSAITLGAIGIVLLLIIRLKAVFFGHEKGIDHRE